MGLDGYRKKIDDIDSRLLDILKERFDVCKEVGKFKHENGFAIEDKEREKAVVDSRVENSDFSEGFVRDLFSLIFTEAKKMQNGLKKD
tara:strand:+ start:740 stop:1003 length:264 start_codon:yes stop_codon:yes gene_type:complete